MVISVAFVGMHLFFEALNLLLTRMPERRGFEVKLTDPVSVAEKKEIDHG
jgi:hypothetical protein